MGWLGEDDPRPAVGEIARGGEASFGDIVQAARRSAWFVDNINARTAALETAYDRANDDIFKATGRRLVHPMRVYETRIGAAAETDPFAEWDLQRRLLAEQNPDKLDLIRPDEDPLEVAHRLKYDTDGEAAATSARYRGAIPGAGTVASFLGGMWGMGRDPTSYGQIFLGPTGRAGAGLKGLAWMAVKQGAANATVEAASQPIVAAWRKEGGLYSLGYDAADFARNVGVAFAFGAAPDAAIRGVYRGGQRALDRVAVLDAEGGVRGYEAREAAMERAARQSQTETLRKAYDGDAAAMEQLAKETGLDQDPVYRSLQEQISDLDATDPLRKPDGSLRRVDRHLDDHAAEQAMRAVLDPDEPLPAAVGERPVTLYRAENPTSEFADKERKVAWYTTDPVRAAGYAKNENYRVVQVTVPAERVRDLQQGVGHETEFAIPLDLHGTRRDVEPGLLEARESLLQGVLEPVEAARVLREHPEALDNATSLAPDAMRQAEAISRLSDNAFAMVDRGEVAPGWGALVANLVEDTARHASILRALQDMRPETVRDARRAVKILLDTEPEPMTGPRAPGDPPASSFKIDDPSGREADLQIEALERALGIDPEGKLPPPRPTPDTIEARALASAFDETPFADVRYALEDVAVMERIGELIKECKI